MKKILQFSKLPIFMFAFPFLFSENPETVHHLSKDKKLVVASEEAMTFSPVIFNNAHDTTARVKRKVIIETDSNGITTKKIIIDGDTLTRIGENVTDFWVLNVDPMVKGFNFNFNFNDKDLNFNVEPFIHSEFQDIHIETDSVMKHFDFDMDFHHLNRNLEKLNDDVIFQMKDYHHLREESMQKMRSEIDSLKDELQKLRNKISEE